jgi:hypothetical protein
MSVSAIRCGKTNVSYVVLNEWRIGRKSVNV